MPVNIVMEASINISVIGIRTVHSIKIITVAVISWISLITVIKKPAGISSRWQANDYQISTNPKIKASLIIEWTRIPHRIIVPIGISKPIRVRVGIIIAAVIIIIIHHRGLLWVLI